MNFITRYACTDDDKCGAFTARLFIFFQFYSMKYFLLFVHSFLFFLSFSRTKKINLAQIKNSYSAFYLTNFVLNTNFPQISASPTTSKITL